MTTEDHQTSNDREAERTAQRRVEEKWMKWLPSDSETGDSSLASTKTPSQATVAKKTPIYVCRACQSFFPKLELANNHVRDRHRRYRAKCMECP